MPLTAQQLQCLFKSKQISYAAEIVWLKRNDQNILLVGEHHVAPTCENGNQDDTQESETCDPNMTHILKTIIRWVKSQKCKLLLEIHPFLWGRAQEEEKQHDTSFEMLHRELGYENLTGFDTRKDFFPPMQIVNELVNVHDFHATNEDPHAEFFRQILLEWVIMPFLIRNSALDTYVTYVRNKSNKLSRPTDKKIWNTQLDEFVDRRHAFAVEKSEAATMGELFTEHQRSGQEMVDLIAISSVLAHETDDFVVFGGIKHVAFEVKLLQRFGFVVKAMRHAEHENINCV